MAIDFPDTSVNNPATGAAWAQGDTINIGGTVYTFNTNAGPPVTFWWSGATGTNLDSRYVLVTGDTMTGQLNTVAVVSGGQVSGTEVPITAGAGNFDLSAGNNFTLASVAVPQPTGGVAGQSGTIRITALPTSWPTGGALKYPGGAVPAPTTFPAIVPFYVQDANNVLLGEITEDIT